MDKEKPILYFENKETTQACLEEWQKILYLNDWIISVDIVTRDQMKNSDFRGQNLFNISNKVAEIYILRPEDYFDNLLKYCAEQILIHELLHCKYNWLVLSDNAEGRFMDEMLHQKLEEMSRSLIMAKYGVSPKWFRA